MKQKDTANATRTALLDAANAVILAKGVNALTLDSVAQKAGVSKGGLLYHFPSKNSLIKGMVERLVLDFESVLDREVANNNGDWLVAYIKSSVAINPNNQQASVALFAAIANDPDLLQPLRERFERWQKKAESLAPSPEIGTIIRLALDGLWASDLFGFAPPSTAMRKKMLTALTAMVNGGGR